MFFKYFFDKVPLRDYVILAFHSIIPVTKPLVFLFAGLDRELFLPPCADN